MTLARGRQRNYKSSPATVWLDCVLAVRQRGTARGQRAGKGNGGDAGKNTTGNGLMRDSRAEGGDKCGLAALLLCRGVWLVVDLGMGGRGFCK